MPQDYICCLAFLFGSLGPPGHGRRGFLDLSFEFFGFGWIFNRGYRKSRRTSEKSLSLVSRVHRSWTTLWSPRVRGSGTFSSGQTPRVAQRAGRFGNVSERQHARCPLTCIMSSTVFWTRASYTSVKNKITPSVPIQCSGRDCPCRPIWVQITCAPSTIGKGSLC